MAVSVLSVLQLANVCWQELRIFASGLDLRGYCCAAVVYVRWPELRVFASGSTLTMDMALQLATFLGRTFVPLPLVLL